MSLIVSPHAVARFRERFPGLCRNGPTDAAIVAAIRACLDDVVATATTVSASGDTIETCRTRQPFVIRAVILRTPTSREVLTVLPGGRSPGRNRGDRPAQKARRAARKAAAQDATGQATGAACSRC